MDGEVMTREEREEALYALRKSTPIMAMTPNEFDDYIKTLNKIADWLEQEPCDDSISRTEAMTEIMMFAGNVKPDEEDIYIKVSDAVQLLRELPPVNLQEPCEDCISREYILSKAHCCRDDFADDEPCCVDADDIKGAPSVQPKPKMGHWKKLNVGYGCSECSLATNKSGVDFYRFCPNCGAKMLPTDLQFGDQDTLMSAT
jgi:DNA-directed RNA polymerase subunit RPC12/RpoP